MEIGSFITSMIQGSPAVVQNEASTAVLKMSMDQSEEMGAALIRMMEQSVNPELGQNIDIKL